MNRLVSLSAIALLAPLMGNCATTPTQINDVITEVEKACQAGCAFVPDVGTIEAILSANNPVLASVQAIATAICSVVLNVPPPVMSQMLRGVRQPPSIAGVVIHGVFTGGPLAGRSL